MKKFLLLVISIKLFGWGADGHKIIGGNSIYFFNSNISQFNNWYSYLYYHSPDPDNRKSSDPTEGPKHFIDIDEIPEFNQYGYLITRNLDSLKKKYNYTDYQISNIGILPWAINDTFDSLKNQFKNNNLTKAQYFAADISHYIADAHMPLHLTKNYDGQYTNQKGIHSRYESDMISMYKNQVTFNYFPTDKINNIYNYTFEYIFQNYKYIDTLLKADLSAKASDPTYGTTYYTVLWDKTKNMTTKLWNLASKRIAEYIYTAYSSTVSSTENQTSNINDKDFILFNPYPNPFNPTTTFTILNKNQIDIKIDIYDIKGQLITTVYNGVLKAGYNNITFSADNLSAGIYIYSIKSSTKITTGKIVLIK